MRVMRAPWWDYADAEWYFVTICTQHRRRLFGSVQDGDVLLSDAGRMIEEWWRKLPDKFPDTGLDEFVIMPDHLHGIVILAPETDDASTALSATIGWFKSMTTNAFIRGVKEHGWERFDGRLWQQSYYDSIRRSDRHIRNMRRYIDANPVRWEARHDPDHG